MIEIQREKSLFTIKFLENDISPDLLQDLLKRLEIERLAEKHAFYGQNREILPEKKANKHHQATLHLLEIAKQSTASSKGRRWTRDELYE